MHSLTVLSADNGTVFSRLALPDAPKTAARVGDRFVLAASHSVTVLEPSRDPFGDGGTSGGDASTDDEESV